MLTPEPAVDTGMPYSLTVHNLMSRALPPAVASQYVPAGPQLGPAFFGRSHAPQTHIRGSRSKGHPAAQPASTSQPRLVRPLPRYALTQGTMCGAAEGAPAVSIAQVHMPVKITIHNFEALRGPQSDWVRRILIPSAHLPLTSRRQATESTRLPCSPPPSPDIREGQYRYRWDDTSLEATQEFLGLLKNENEGGRTTQLTARGVAKLYTYPYL